MHVSCRPMHEPAVACRPQSSRVRENQKGGRVMATRRDRPSSISCVVALLLLALLALAGCQDGTVPYENGLVYLNKGDLDTALIYFEKTTRPRKVRAQAYDKRALICLAKRDFEAAIQCFGEVI